MIPTFFIGGVSTEGAKWDSVDDPNWANVVLLMRMEGSDGGSTFNDSGPLGTSITNVGHYSTSTTFAKSGSASCKCEATDVQQLYYTNASAHQLGGDLTGEVWLYMTLAPVSIGVAVDINPGSIQIGSDRKAIFDHAGTKITGTTALSLNAWHHLAITRSGTTMRMWIDGAQEGSNYTSSATFNTSGQKSAIGNIFGLSGKTTYLDLLRVTKADRYGTSSFTPPADY